MWGKRFRNRGKGLFKTSNSRLSRYVLTFWWLLSFQYSRAPLLCVTSIASGVFGRIGNILTLIVTVKCAFWLLHPSGPPSFIKSFLAISVGDDALIGYLIALPLVSVLITAIADLIHNRTAIALKSNIAYLLARTVMESEFKPQHDNVPSDREAAVQAKYAANRFKTLYSTFFRVQTMFFVVIVASITVLLAASAGLLLAPMIIAIVMSIAIVLSAAFIAGRHSRSHKVEKQKRHSEATWELARERYSEKIKEWFLSKDAQSNIEQASRDYWASIEQLRSQDDSFRSQSANIANLGQGLMLSLLLLVLYLHGATADAHQLANLAVVILIVRFALGQLTSISNHAVRLSKDYALLVAVATRCKKPAVVEPASHETQT